MVNAATFTFRSANQIDRPERPLSGFTKVHYSKGFVKLCILTNPFFHHNRYTMDTLPLLARRKMSNEMMVVSIRMVASAAAVPSDMRMTS